MHEEAINILMCGIRVRCEIISDHHSVVNHMHTKQYVRKTISILTQIRFYLWTWDDRWRFGSLWSCRYYTNWRSP